VSPAPDPATRGSIIDAAGQVLHEQGYNGLSTRRIAEMAGVPLSQIHYHFGSKSNLVLALFAEQNAQLLRRQADMFGSEAPLWKRWEQACDFLDDDLQSGYVRILQEMMAAGWSDDDVRAAVHERLGGWFDLLHEVADEVEERIGGPVAVTARELAALVGAAFLGAEALILLGFAEERVPVRSALRSLGGVIRAFEEAAD